MEWNTFLPNVFISCAGEWNVKIWDMNNSSPLYTFDTKSPAGDVAWAPYSRYSSKLHIELNSAFSFVAHLWRWLLCAKLYQHSI